MFSRFFIDRPIFATVLSIVITLAGGLAMFNLPLAQYPPVTPPTVQVSCTYPGASAEVVAATVAAPIEQQVNGVERMLYMESQSANDGSYSLQVTFEQGMDLNLAQVLVQNRVNLALPMMPDVIKQTGVTTRKRVPDILMCVNIQSPHGRYDQLYLSNYALMYIRDELLRLPGTGDIFIAGERDYSMRIWVDPGKLAARNLTAGDVVAALREQNAEVAVGQIGQQPVPRGQQTQIPLTTLGRLKTPEQFADIILRATPDGRIIRIRDVGRVVLGAKNEDLSCRCNCLDSVGLIIFQLPDANALAVGDEIRAKMKELARNFPDDMSYVIRYDTTPYTRDCIEEVKKALLDSVLLVALVVLLFLQNWRSAIIPLIAVPVAIIGTFAVMKVVGFSLNNLTLFGLVLAIGIVVDDAIVVVEAVEHHIENGLLPRDATIKAMSQVSGPVVAVGLVLSAVFVPCAFISGITGQFFRQFAVTIAASTVISAFNSLSLSPALSALLLRPREKGQREVLPRLVYALAGGWLAWKLLTPEAAGRLAERLGGRLALDAGTLAQLAAAAPWIAAVLGVGAGWALGRPLNAVLGRLFRLFNDAFGRATSAYLRGVGMLLRTSALVLVVYCGLLVLTGWCYFRTPKGFVPTQDMGYLLMAFQLPDAASAERTAALTQRVETICATVKGVSNLVEYNGINFLLSVNGSNFATMFVMLDDFDKRRTPELYADAIAERLQRRLMREVPEANVIVVGGATYPRRGPHGRVQVRGGRPGRPRSEDLGAADGQVDGQGPHAARDQRPAAAATAGQCLPRQRAAALLGRQPQAVHGDGRAAGRSVQHPADLPGIALRQRLQPLRPHLGGDRPGRRALPHPEGGGGPTEGPQPCRGHGARGRPGLRQGCQRPLDHQPLQHLPRRLDQRQHRGGDQLPAGDRPVGPPGGQGAACKGMFYEWTEMAYFEVQAGNKAMAIFAIAVLMVFLVLAAQYESWSLPLAVILVVPMCLLCAIVGVSVMPLLLPKSLVGGGTVADINIFTQIGFVVLVGLASKNAILIVEFAKHQREGGASGFEATLAACKLRLRPIVMTSAAFILGALPLLVASGAGAEMRRTLGTAVFCGMLGVTLFGIFLTPVFFSVIDAMGGTSGFVPACSSRFSWSRWESPPWDCSGCCGSGTALLRWSSLPWRWYGSCCG